MDGHAVCRHPSLLHHSFTRREWIGQDEDQERAMRRLFQRGDMNGPFAILLRDIARERYLADEIIEHYDQDN